MKNLKLSKQQLKMAVTLAALKDENKFEDGTPNWNFIDSDVCIDHLNEKNGGNTYEDIEEALNEVADEYYAHVPA